MTTEKAFYDFADALLDNVLEMNPVAATQFGNHRWDDRLADRSPEALEAEHQYLVESLSALQAMETTAVSPGFIDPMGSLPSSKPPSSGLPS